MGYETILGYIVGQKRIRNFLRIPFYEYEFYEGKNLIKRWIINKNSKLVKDKNWIVVKDLKMAFFKPKKNGYTDKSGERHMFNMDDAEELTDTEIKDYIPHYELFRIRWDGKPTATRKISMVVKDKEGKDIVTSKELEFVHAGVSPLFFNEILDSVFTKKIIEEKPKPWAWLEPYLPYIIGVVFIIAILMIIQQG